METQGTATEGTCHIKKIPELCCFIPAVIPYLDIGKLLMIKASNKLKTWAIKSRNFYFSN